MYAGDTEVAEVLTMEVLSREPEDALARAVQVEILMRAGTQDEARLLAQGTIRSGEAPRWLVDHLRNVLASTESP